MGGGKTPQSTNTQTPQTPGKWVNGRDVNVDTAGLTDKPVLKVPERTDVGRDAGAFVQGVSHITPVEKAPIDNGGGGGGSFISMGGQSTEDLLDREKKKKELKAARKRKYRGLSIPIASSTSSGSSNIVAAPSTGVNK